jgi:hypothetical protein
MPQMIPNPGAFVGFIHEKRFRKLRFYRNYLSTVQRLLLPAQATLARLGEAWALYERIKKKDVVTHMMPDKLKKQDEARKVIENLDYYLTIRRNVHGVPLSYLVRDEAEAPDVANDPGHATPSFDDEMIRRAPHTGAIYAADNKTLWDIVRTITRDGLDGIGFRPTQEQETEGKPILTSKVTIWAKASQTRSSIKPMPYSPRHVRCTRQKERDEEKKLFPCLLFLFYYYHVMVGNSIMLSGSSSEYSGSSSLSGIAIASFSSIPRLYPMICFLLLLQHQ